MFKEDILNGDRAVRLQLFLRSLAQALVDDVLAVSVTVCFQDDETIWLALGVADQDLDKVIGPHASIAKSLRTIVSGAALKRGFRCHIEIVDQRN